MTATIYIQRKKSGNYILSAYNNPTWELIETANTPAELLDKAKKLSNYNEIILSEYSKSQRKTKALFFNERDALYAFGIDKSKAAMEQYFNVAK